MLGVGTRDLASSLAQVATHTVGVGASHAFWIADGEGQLLASGGAAHLDGALVAIGNAPTALFRLLELIADGAPPPALILGFAVGFVGAAESKQALIDHAGRLGVSFITLKGRRGGSAMASAAVNALSKGNET